MRRFGDDVRKCLGGCHCGAVRYEVAVPADAVAFECNCSICRVERFQGLILPRSAFRLLKGEESLSEYRFNTGTARHLFCRVCGVKSFYVPRSNPDGVSVNVRCLESGWQQFIRIEAFDGQNWEVNAGPLAKLSEELSR